jgi:hypothetical protein
MFHCEQFSEVDPGGWVQLIVANLESNWRSSQRFAM